MPSAPSICTTRTSHKRLIICCDGTGQQTDAPPDVQQTNKGEKTDEAGRPKDWVVSSNITRLCRLVKEVTHTPDGVEMPQVVYYQSGVGTGPGPWLSKILAAGFGTGLNENVVKAYVWLALNWVEGDEIFIFGFSRGAYTARALGSLVCDIGLLPKAELGDFQRIYSKYEVRNLSVANFSAWKEVLDFRQSQIHDCLRIKVIGVFDTVGSLGIPETGFSSVAGTNREYSFYDTTIHPRIENAFHALALDERRLSFAPTLWFLPKEGSSTNLKQCWFAGVHSDVGGSYENLPKVDISDISLRWMISQCSPMIDFNTDLLNEWTGLANEPDVNPQAWAGQELHNSMDGIYVLGKQKVRTPGQYTMEEWTPGTGKLCDVPAGPSNETIHASCRARLLKSKRGELVGNHKWPAAALTGFTLSLGKTADGKAGWVWTKDSLVLCEEPLGALELGMLTSADMALLADEPQSQGLTVPGDKTGKPGILGRFTQSIVRTFTGGQ